WLDWMLIRLFQKFADYRKEDPTSFRLLDNFSIYPQFMSYLWRSHFLPADSAMMHGCRHIHNEEDANNLLIMIKPTFNVLPQPVLLDSVSIKPNIILLDTFFHILMFHRESFFHWRKAGRQDHGSYKNFKELLEALVTDAQVCTVIHYSPIILSIQHHFPILQYIVITVAIRLVSCSRS
ncbi:hypothetical protein EDC04DRAFT_2575113, partial [Pisolithus marmoratus]